MPLEKKTLNDVFKSNLGEENLNELLKRQDINELSSMYKIVEIDIDLLSPNPYQPRKFFDESKLHELSQSIIQQGLITPILVKQLADGKYIIIAGERRYRAVKLANQKTIKAIVCNLSNKAIEEISLLENTQREDLNSIEEATAYHQLISKYNYTQEELAKRIGKSREYITNILRLLKLPDKIKDDIIEGNLTQGHARALLSLKDDSNILDTVETIKANNMTVREVEKLVKRKKNMPERITISYDGDSRGETIDMEIKQLEHSLNRQIIIKNKKLSISYKDEDDLLQLLKKLQNK